MNKDLYDMIVKYNKVQNENSAMAKDLKIILDEMRKLPYGQLKKVLTNEVIEVFEKYGIY